LLADSRSSEIPDQMVNDQVSQIICTIIISRNTTIEAPINIFSPVFVIILPI
jgi:hypothetical protein